MVHSMVPQIYHGTCPSTSDITMVHSAVHITMVHTTSDITMVPQILPWYFAWTHGTDIFLL